MGVRRLSKRNRWTSSWPFILGSWFRLRVASGETLSSSRRGKLVVCRRGCNRRCQIRGSKWVQSIQVGRVNIYKFAQKGLDRETATMGYVLKSGGEAKVVFTSKAGKKDHTDSRSFRFTSFSETDILAISLFHKKVYTETTLYAFVHKVGKALIVTSKWHLKCFLILVLCNAFNVSLCKKYRIRCNLLIL